MQVEPGIDNGRVRVGQVRVIDHVLHHTRDRFHVTAVDFIEQPHSPFVVRAFHLCALLLVHGGGRQFMVRCAYG